MQWPNKVNTIFLNVGYVEDGRPATYTFIPNYKTPLDLSPSQAIISLAEDWWAYYCHIQTYNSKPDISQEEFLFFVWEEMGRSPDGFWSGDGEFCGLEIEGEKITEDRTAIWIPHYVSFVPYQAVRNGNFLVVPEYGESLLWAALISSHPEYEKFTTKDYRTYDFENHWLPFLKNYMEKESV